MKLYVENANKNPDKLGGKSLFCFRLAEALQKKGVNIIRNPLDDADVSINVIRLKHQKSKVRILRLDGVWHDTGKDFIQKNKSLKENLMRANGVVYQSDFAKRMSDRYLGKPACPTKIIFNGSDPDFYKNSSFVEEPFENVFLAFSKWRPHKRLKDTIESFLLATIKNSILIVAGDISKCDIKQKELKRYFSLPNVRWLGLLSQYHLAAYLKVAKASIHLCWFDACPNSVVEAIIAGVPVICNNVGGTQEIVKPSGGYVCNIDEPYDLRPVDLYHPPQIDRSVVAEALNKCLKEKPVISNNHVDINNIANQYLQFIRECYERASFYC